MNAPQPVPDANDRDATIDSVVPPPCPTCHGARTWDIDPSDTDAEWFLWCEHCATGDFPSEVDA